MTTTREVWLFDDDFQEPDGHPVRISEVREETLKHDKSAFWASALDLISDEQHNGLLAAYELARKNGDFEMLGKLCFYAFEQCIDNLAILKAGERTDAFVEYDD